MAINKSIFIKYKKIFKRFRGGIFYIFLNGVVSHIPCWWIRKIIYKSFGMKIGINSRINIGVIVMKPWNIEIGNNTMINENAILDGRGGVPIGNSCSISMRSIIYSASHYCDSDSFKIFYKHTRIGDCVWVGANSVILPGSYLNDFSVIGANSLFKGNSIQHGIYCGVPAVLVRFRSEMSKYNLDLSDIGFFV